MSTDDAAITPRAEPPPNPAAGDDAALARALLREAMTASLATLDPAGGHPFASLVTVATDFGGAPLLLVSRLALHTRNMRADGRVSLLLSRPGKGDPLAHPRLTLSGMAAPAEAPHLRRRFLARHPKAALYAGFPDFGFWRVEPGGTHLVAGFGRAPELPPAALLTDLTGAGPLLAAEPDAVAHMNADHAEAIGLYAVHLGGAAPGPWRLAGLDPEGMDLLLEGRGLRVPFPERVTDPGALRRLLARLAAEARADG
ncbi:MAG: Pyridoxamine 5-phosphate oxidase family protein [Roseomonas sp.]|nr:Pyridoxamine 5-phosphate oxidase family protein [Roseomonas sp.]